MARLLLRLSLVALSLALALTVVVQLRMPREAVQVLALPDEVLGLAVAQPTAPPPAESAAATPAALPAVPTAVPTLAPESVTVTLQQGRDGYQGTTDTFIQFFAQEANYCGSPELFVVTTDKAAALLRFDLSGLSDSASGLDAGAAVVKATLEVYAVQGNPGVRIGLYLPHSDWDPCSATWTKPWAVPGANGAADREPEPLLQIASDAAPEWLRFDVSALVSQWLSDPSGNHGVILKSLEAAVPSQHILFSSENEDAERRPRLTIEYTRARPTAEPTATPLSAETPLATSPSVESTPGANPSGTAAPTLAPVPEPTAIAPGSPRVIEIRYWTPMEVGGSYPVSLVFRPEKKGLSTNRYESYVLGVNAQLNAATFEITAEATPLQILTNPETALVWRWTLQPGSTGQHTLEFDVDLNWTPAVPGQPPVRTEPGSWQQTRATRVNAAFAYWPVVRLARLVLMALGLLSWLGWLVLHQRRRQL